MKVTITTFLALASLAIASGLPASVRDVNDEVEIVPLERRPYGDQPIVDTGVFSYGPFSNPFGGLLENLEGIMTRMRQQMETLLKRFPITRGNSTEEIPDFPPLGVPSFGDFDLGKGNTSSVTKVIDGHKVVINETEYKKEDDFGGAFFKVRIIDVRPDSSEVTTNSDAEVVSVTTPSPVPDRESIENSAENEIVKTREAPYTNNIETFDEVINPYQKFKYTPDMEPAWNNIESIEPFEENSITGSEHYLKPIDLSGDIRVNQILAESGAPINPDAEFIYDFREPQNLKQTERFINPR